MLKIIFGEVENAVCHPPTYFDNQYEDEWITDPLTVAMIKDIDKSDVVGVHLIQSPVLGPISVKEISGGVKTLILMAFDRSGRIFTLPEPVRAARRQARRRKRRICLSKNIKRGVSNVQSIFKN